MRWLLLCILIELFFTTLQPYEQKLVSPLPTTQVFAVADPSGDGFVSLSAPSPTPSTALSPVNWAISNAFEEFGQDVVVRARQVAFCESSLRPGATHENRGGSQDRGLFQLNSRFHNVRNWEDPTVNSNYAAELYRRQGWNPWAASKDCWINQ